MLERMIRDSRLSPQLYEEVEGDTGATSQAMMVVVLVAVATGIGTTGAGGAAGLFSGIVFGLLSWAVWAYVTLHRGHLPFPDAGDKRQLGRARQDYRLRSVSGPTANPGVPPGNRAGHLPGRLSLATRRHGRSGQTTPGLRVHLAGGGGSDSRVHRAGEFPGRSLRSPVKTTYEAGDNPDKTLASRGLRRLVKQGYILAREVDLKGKLVRDPLHSRLAVETDVGRIALVVPAGKAFPGT